MCKAHILRATPLYACVLYHVWSSGDILDTSPGFIIRMGSGITNVVVRGHPGDIPGFPVDM